MLIPNNCKEIDLYVLLNKFFSSEFINFNTICEKCHKKTQQIKITKFAIMSKILIISLQRFDFRNNLKNDCQIKFDEFIDINKFIDDDLLNEKIIFKLFGIIKHFGDIISGHYVSYINLKICMNLMITM